jgi:hypothetical protein
MVVDGRPASWVSFVFGVSHRGLVLLSNDDQTWSVDTAARIVTVTTHGGREFRLEYTHVGYELV